MIIRSGDLYRFAIKGQFGLRYYDTKNEAIFKRKNLYFESKDVNNKIFTIINLSRNPFDSNKIIEILFEEKKYFLSVDTKKTFANNQIKKVLIEKNGQ